MEWNKRKQNLDPISTAIEDDHYMLNDGETDGSSFIDFDLNNVAKATSALQVSLDEKHQETLGNKKRNVFPKFGLNYLFVSNHSHLIRL